MTKNIKITYLKKATKFLEKNSNVLAEYDVDELIIKSIKKIFYFMDINIDLKKLKGKYKNVYRVRKGNIRIIFKTVDNEVIVEAVVVDIDYRGGVYK